MFGISRRAESSGYEPMKKWQARKKPMPGDKADRQMQVGPRSEPAMTILREFSDVSSTLVTSRSAKEDGAVF